MSAQDSSVKNLYIVGAVSGLLKTALAVPIYFLLTPLVLKTLGAEMYAIWSLGAVVISLINIFDFGFKNSVIKYVAEDPNDKDKVSEYFTIFMSFYLFVGAFATLIVFAFHEYYVDDVLSVSSDYKLEAEFTLFITAFSFFFRFIASPYQALIESKQKIYLSHIIFLVWLLSNFFLSVLGLKFYPGIYVLGLAMFVSNFLVFVLFFAVAKKEYPHRLFKYSNASYASFKKLLSFGLGIFVSSIVIIFREPIVKTIVVRFYGLEDSALFDISYRTTVQIMSFLISPIMGTFALAALYSTNKTKLEKAILPIFGYLVAFTLPLGVSILIFGEYLLEVWLAGSSVDISRLYPLVICVTGAFLIYYIVEPIYKTNEAMGFSTLTALIQLVSLVIIISMLFTLPAQDVLNIGWSILSGFTFYMAANIGLSYWIFGKIYFVSIKSLFYIVIPTVCIVAATVMQRDTSLLVAFLLFAIYLFIHFYITKRQNVFDLGELLFSLFNRIRQKKV